MSPKRVVQRGVGAREASFEAPDLARAAGEYLTTRELAAYLGYRGKRAQGAAQKFVARAGLRRYWRSARVSLVRRADVDAVLAGKARWNHESTVAGL